MAYPSFCGECGAPLKEGQKYCAVCGRRVEPLETNPQQGNPINQAPTVPQPIVLPTANQTPPHAYQPTEPRATSYEYAFTQPTDEMPAIQKQHVFRQPEQKDQLEKKPTKSIIVGIVVGLLVIAALVLGFLAFNPFKSQDNSSQPTQEDTNHLEETTKQESTTTSAVPSEEKIYQNLLNYYQDLAGFDQEISTAADNFNSNYLKEDMVTRNRYATSALELQSKLKEAQQSLTQYAVPSSSINYHHYTDMLACYEACLNRINVICEAWDNSLSYDDPEGHEEEILAPLRSNNGAGSSNYLQQFDELYPNAQPARP